MSIPLPPSLAEHYGVADGKVSRSKKYSPHGGDKKCTTSSSCLRMNNKKLSQKSKETGNANCRPHTLATTTAAHRDFITYETGLYDDADAAN
jgi:hypothetical protein